MKRYQYELIGVKSSSFGGINMRHERVERAGDGKALVNGKTATNTGKTNGQYQIWRGVDAFYYLPRELGNWVMAV